MQYAVNKKIISINPMIDVALPKQVEKKTYHTRNWDGQDFSEDNYIEQISEFLAWN